jgi:putative nucleotidyltransferase with HDIG domain
LKSSTTPSSSRGRVFIGAVVVIGLLVVADSIWRLANEPPGPQLFALAALTLLTGSFTVKIPSLSARLSVSETFVFTSALLFGPAAGTATVVLDALIACLWLKSKARSVARVLFNATAPAIAIWISSHVFFAMADTTAGALRSKEIGTFIAPLFTFALLYFLINTWLVAGALSTQQGGGALYIWRTNFPAVSITYFVGASIAMLIVAYTPRIDLTVVGIILPFLLISYLTFRSSMGRLEDANRHVSQLNELYLSTIETLAMAVDAKDQITHGHIRRVQVYATELATRLGVNDEQQLSAIKAAALLHDMGKLAIPEHILNKPGKLTSGEFEKMKRHSDIGADLLASIPFPYPVVPLVRHHHENWDGTGYPNGIAGTDIPLGARILAVVDCFDALTSDRPYRPKLTDEAAFTILRERRATMYDPLVVDAFEAAYASIAPIAAEAGRSAKTLVPMRDQAVTENSSLDEIRRSASEMRDVVEARSALAHCGSLQDAVEVLARVARTHSAATVLAFYAYESSTDVFRCIAASGDKNGLLTNLAIPSGERTTGWAAAHRQTVSNSSAALDLGSCGRNFVPPLKSALAMPFEVESGRAAVLTLYSTLDSPFGDRDRYIVEQLANLIAEFLASPTARPAPVVRLREVPRAGPARK